MEHAKKVTMPRRLIECSIVGILFCVQAAFAEDPAGEVGHGAGTCAQFAKDYQQNLGMEFLCCLAFQRSLQDRKSDVDLSLLKLGILRRCAACLVHIELDARILQGDAIDNRGENSG